MNILTVIMLIFSVIGAIDRIFGGRLGLVKQFEKGYMLLGNMALSMLGMIIVAPLLSSWISPALDFVYNAFGIDPSIIPASIFANDMGGTAMGLEVMKNQSVGAFNALVVSSMMGCTISFTIPFALGVVDKSQHKSMFTGMLCGIATIPIGCFVSGLFCNVGIFTLLINLLPLIIFAALIVLGLLYIPNISINIFKGLGWFMSAVITVGLVLGGIGFLSGSPVINGLGDMTEATMICMNASIVLSGSFTLMHIVSLILKKPLRAFGKVLGINEASSSGFISTIVTNAATFGNMKDMDDKGVILNSAFAVSAAFVFGSHLAFTLAYAPNLVFQVIIGKLVSGICSVVLAVLISKRI